MRTRSQPISPSGFQSLETAPRKRKAPSSAAPARKGPAKNSNNPAKVAKSKAGKRAPKTKKAPAATSTPTPSTPTPVRPEEDGPSPQPQPESSNPPPAEEPSILDALEHNVNSAVPTPPTPEVESSANVAPNTEPINNCEQQTFSSTGAQGASDFQTTGTQCVRALSFPPPHLSPRRPRTTIPGRSPLFAPVISPLAFPRTPRLARFARFTRLSPPSPQETEGPRMTSTGMQTSSTVPQCPCCSSKLICPNGHDLDSFPGTHQPYMTTPLTQLPVTPRKRTRRTAEDDSADMPSSKRRELGASSVARHKKRNVTPYSERRRRKALEDKGRIDKTIFRIPELISQNKTDQDTADSSKSYSTDRDQEPDWKVLDQMRADLQSQEETEQPAPPQTPQTPQTPTRGWHFRGLLDSVPRSLARFIPTIANSPSRTPRQTDDSVPDQFTTPPETSRSPVSPAQQKNTLLQPTQPLEKRDLSYSLYPPPIDRSSFLEPISPPIPTPREPISEVATPHPSTPQVSTPQVSTSQVPTPRTAVTNENQAESSGNKPNVPPTKSKKRRKKTIPNPPGCSYGMDMRYFGDTTSESETDTDADDESEEPVRGLTTKPTQRTIRGILRGRKRVRFDASPEDVPSKLRLRERQYPRPARSQRIAAQPSASYEETPSTPITTSTPIASSTPLISTPITTSTPTASTPISSTPISSAPITATPITATPITATPITATPITATPISSAPITATPIAATPIASTPITTSTPTTSTPTSSIPTTSTPITNHSGTYCLDYDMFSSSDEEMEEETQAQPDEVMAAENTQQESQNVDNAPVTEMAQQETLTNVNIAPVAENPQEETQTNAAEASVVEQGRTTQADVVSAGGEGEAGRLLNPAEKYRPRQPSKLRVSHRYSSPIAPLAEASPSGVNISRLVEEMWSPEDQESADAVFNREFGRFCRSRLEEGEGEEGGEGGEVGGEGGEEEEGRAVVPFQLDSYGEFCSALEGYRRGR